MLDFNDLNFDEMLIDIDGDGIPDMQAIGVDIDGDGIADMYGMGVDVDGDGVVDAYVMDENNDGIYDSTMDFFDSDNDGFIDSVAIGYDENNDGIIDLMHTHNFETDEESFGQYIDSDGDNVVDTYLYYGDSDNDGVYDSVEIYDVDEVTGAITFEGIEYINDLSASTNLYELENFDPAEANPENVSGDPAHSMQEWEYQGDTGRCALYSQKFVIEELTGKELDIEQIADIAEANGWFSEERGTTLIDMNKILDYYGVQNEMSFGGSIDDIKDCLDNGGRVIVSIDCDEIWYGEEDNIFTPFDGPNHAVEVIGIDYSDPDNPMVILNDSGNPDGCGEMISLDVFQDAWEDGNCHMIECY